MSEITVPYEVKSNLYSLLNKRRAIVFEEENLANTPLCIVKCHLPVAESFGFTDKLREVTNGKALNQCIFDHWQILPGDPYEKGSKQH